MAGKYGYFRLPSLNKNDYILLETLRKALDATQLEVLMAALRAYAAMSPRGRRWWLTKWRAPEAAHEELHVVAEPREGGDSGS